MMGPRSVYGPAAEGAVATATQRGPPRFFPTYQTTKRSVTSSCTSSGAQKEPSAHAGWEGKIDPEGCQWTRSTDRNRGNWGDHSLEVEEAQKVPSTSTIVGSGWSPGTTGLIPECSSWEVLASRESWIFAERTPFRCIPKQVWFLSPRRPASLRQAWRAMNTTARESCWKLAWAGAGSVRCSKEGVMKLANVKAAVAKILTVGFLAGAVVMFAPQRRRLRRFSSATALMRDITFTSASGSKRFAGIGSLNVSGRSGAFIATATTVDIVRSLGICAPPSRVVVRDGGSILRYAVWRLRVRACRSSLACGSVKNLKSGPIVLRSSTGKDLL